MFSIFKSNEKAREEQRIKEARLLLATRYMEENSIPNDYIKVFCSDVDGYIRQYPSSNSLKRSCDLAIWRDKDNLYINNLVSEESWTKTEYRLVTDTRFMRKINFSNLVGFGYFGEIEEYTEISGGGVSVGGAIIGGVIAGPVGAILNGRKQIKTEQKTKDNRKLYLIIQEDGRTYNLLFENHYYETFLKLIPDKELNVKKNIEANNNIDIYSDIEKLATLKERGILTEEEFNIKKNELLNRI